MPSRSNVTHLKPSTLPTLRSASTSAQGGRIPGSRNEVWLCAGYDDLGRGVVLYIKPLLSTRQIMAEVLAAQVGQCMGLPCPNPYIVTVNPRHIGRKAGPKVVAFGSEQVSDRSMSRPILDVDILLDALRRQKVEDVLSAFDEFIANPVRSPRDIIFTPDTSVAVIDHEGAMEPGTKPGEAVTNWLADRVLERLQAGQHAPFLGRLRAKTAALHSIGFGSAPSVLQFDQRGVETYNTLVDFVRQRLEHLDRLLSERVLPEQTYIAPNDADDAPDRTANF